MAKITIYLFVAISVVGAIWAIRQSGFDAGERAAEQRMQRRVDEANARADQQAAQARHITEVSERAIAEIQRQSDDAFDRGRRSIRPVRLCPQAPGGGQVPTVAGAASGADAGAGEGGLPVQAGEDHRPAADLPDIGPALIDVMASCQKDGDDAAAWRAWYKTQQAAAGP